MTFCASVCVCGKSLLVLNAKSGLIALGQHFDLTLYPYLALSLSLTLSLSLSLSVRPHSSFLFRYFLIGTFVKFQKINRKFCGLKKQERIMERMRVKERDAKGRQRMRVKERDERERERG